MLFSKETEEILEKRAKAVERGEEEEYDRLTREFRKSKGKDKREGVIKTTGKYLYIRDGWAVIKRTKTNINHNHITELTNSQANTYIRKREQRKHPNIEVRSNGGRKKQERKKHTGEVK